MRVSVAEAVNRVWEATNLPRRRKLQLIHLKNGEGGRETGGIKREEEERRKVEGQGSKWKITKNCVSRNSSNRDE